MPTASNRRAPSALTEIGAAVSERIDALLSDELHRWSEVDASLAEPLAYLRKFVAAGGKRLRPAFCYWAFVGAGGQRDDSDIVDAGAALELLHTFALVHDDVMDGSTVRRGLDAVHSHFARAHDEGEWTGEGRRFGEGVAILVGDLAFVYADQLMPASSPAAFAVFNDLRLEVNVGQYLDLVATARSQHDLASAMRIARYKSSMYTVERPLHLGAALAGRLDELGAGLSAFGTPLGDAFQLRDDLLGAFGDPAAIGKPVGDDLREGKATALVALAKQRADAAQSRILESHLGQRDLDDSGVAEVQRVLVDTGARGEVERRIRELTEEAHAALLDVRITDEARQHLADLADFVAGREY